MDHGTGESALELRLVADLSQRDDRVRHRRPDVGAHDHGNGLSGKNGDSVFEFRVWWRSRMKNL